MILVDCLPCLFFSGFFIPFLHSLSLSFVTSASIPVEKRRIVLGVGLGSALF